MNKVVCFIGGGNMSTAILKGLIAHNYSPENLIVIDHNQSKCDVLAQSLSIQTFTSISALKAQNDIFKGVDIFILAVKPQVFSKMLQELKGIEHQPLLISVAAGITIEMIAQGFVENTAIVRAMPNTPAAIGLGATGLFANKHCSSTHKQWAQQLFEACGLCLWIETENLISAVVAVSGSGPAYFFYMLEAMEKAGIKLGLDPENARTLALQTCLGAATLAQNSQLSPQELRAQVTSPNGTTEQAIKSFQDNDFEEIVFKAMQACFNKDQNLTVV